MPAVGDFQIPADALCLADYERHAKARLPAPVWAYISGAGADGITRRWNREAFDRLKLSGRVLADMRAASTRMTLLGLELPAPILIAPTAFQKLAHPDGETATALGAGALGTCMAVSVQASASLEEIAAASPPPLWFQLYMQVERSDSLELVRRAEAAGYKAVVVTVDASVNGVRNEEQRAGFRLPAGVEAVNLRGMRQPSHNAGPGESPVFKGLLAHAPRWEDLAWLITQTSLPVVVKGVMHPGDALRALEVGAAAIVVSNHGGRTLDTLPATMEVLPAVASAIAGRVPVLLDGGIRRGTDVLKALALGADAVMLGQPVVHGLAVGGAAGVAHVLAILRAELEVAMALTGCATVAEIDRRVLWEAGATVAAPAS